ncbi:MAG: hypothetical protein IJD39_03560 [Clostridia bacterium]|nr:hypothetical protein [Clostridia bacterium]
MSKKPGKQQGGFKEFIRKTIVSLKRKPQMIPMLVLAAAFLYYSLNLTQISNTTAKIQLGGMGLTGFCTMLFSMLSFVCFLNAYPHRKKTNIPMLALAFLMMGILIFCDTFYAARIIEATTRADHPISMADFAYIGNAHHMLMVHRIIVAVGVVLTALVPVLRKLLRKINTSLIVEESAQMNELDLSEEA